MIIEFRIFPNENSDERKYCLRNSRFYFLTYPRKIPHHVLENDDVSLKHPRLRVGEVVVSGLAIQPFYGLDNGSSFLVSELKDMGTT